jgi:hypothetical protein
VKDPGTDGTKKVTVDGAKRSPLEVPSPSVVVRKRGVGVLKERNHNEPVVREEVGNSIVLDDVSETADVVTEDGESSEGEDEEEVGEEDLVTVTLVEDDGVGGEVVRPGGEVLLTRGVDEEVGGPSDELRATEGGGQ